MKLDTDLPFLIVHGAIIWKLLLIVVVTISCIGVACVRGWCARRGARRDVASRLRPRSPSAGGTVTMRGILHVGEVVTLSRGGGHLISHRSDSLVVQVDGELLQVVGDVRVVHGARERATWFRKPRGLPASFERYLGPGRHAMIRSVGVGDEVVLAGVPRISADLCGTYRGGGIGRSLVGASGPIEVSRIRPSARAAALGIGWIPTVALSTVFGWLALATIGACAVRRVERASKIDVAPFGYAAIAAAMPESRDRALQALQRQASDGPRSESALRIAFALAEYTGSCPIELFDEMGRYEETLEVARRCGRPRDVEDALVTLGRYDEAARVMPQDPAPMVALARGDWSAAARMTDAIADRAHDPDSNSDSPRSQTALRCMAALFRHFAGEPARFDSVPSGAGSTRCAMYRAFTLPPEERIATLNAIRGRRVDFTIDRVARWFLRASGAPVRDPLSSTALHLEWLSFGDVSLAQFEGDSEGPIAIRAQHAAHLTELAMIRGDHVAARASCQRVDDMGLLDLSSVRRMLAVHAGDGIDAQLVASDVPEERTLRSMRCDDDVTGRALADARAGDGHPLARALSTCRLYAIPSNFELILDAVPHVTNGRDELAAQLRLYRDAPHARGPFELLPALATYRDLARLAGDHDEEARLQRMIDRHLAVLADSRRVIALMLWGEL